MKRLNLVVRTLFVSSVIAVAAAVPSNARAAIRLKAEGFSSAHLAILRNDLIRLQGLQSRQSSQLFKKFFGHSSFLGTSVHSLFKNSVRALKYFPQGFNAEPSSVAWYLSKTKTVGIGPKFFSDSWIARVGALVHEASHAQFPGHARCPNPYLDSRGREFRSPWSGRALSGQLACANSLDDAYTAHFIFLDNLARFCLNCSPQERERARREASYVWVRLIGKDLRDLVLKDMRNFYH